MGGRPIVRQVRPIERGGIETIDVATGTPLWARAEVEGATFEPRRISRDRRTPRLVAGFGVAGLAALVVAGLGPARTPPLEVADAATNRVPVAVVAPVPADHRGWPPSQPAIEAIAPVSLSAPIRQTGPLTGPTVPVRGKLLIRAASVRVQLETNDRHALATAVVDTANRDGGIRPLHAPSVDVVLRIPMPRPVGWLWLVITAYDGAGTPIATMRRAVDVGAARESARR